MSEKSETETFETGAEPVSKFRQLFDLRLILCGLFLTYGVVLVVMALVSDSAADMRKTGGIAINLWTGLGMLATAAAFGLWARSRPAHRRSVNPDEA